MILDGLLWVAAVGAWTWVLWFYGRAEYREPQWWRLFVAVALCAALLGVPWAGWLLGALAHYLLLQRAFRFPPPAARLMTAAVLALYGAVRLLFAFAGPPPPPL